MLVRGRGDGSFLDHIQYRTPDKETNSRDLIQEMVISDMLRLPEWYEKLGLNFHDTMQLEYAQYFKLRNQLKEFEERVKRETPKALEKVEKDLLGGAHVAAKR